MNSSSGSSSFLGFLGPIVFELVSYIYEMGNDGGKLVVWWSVEQYNIMDMVVYVIVYWLIFV